MTNDLAVTNISKSFATAGGELPILVNANLSLSRGDALAITGPSGAGKSTLLFIIGTLDAPNSGTVLILGQDPFSLERPSLARFRNANVGFIFQDHYLLPQCTVLENVLLPTLAGSATGRAAEERAGMLLDKVGLARRLRHRPAELSGGERQRVAICRALINRPPLLLADEPTGNLDRHSAESVGSLLLNLCHEENVMLIVVTHSTELAASLPRHCKLVDGKLLE